MPGPPSRLGAARTHVSSGIATPFESISLQRSDGLGVSTVVVVQDAADEPLTSSLQALPMTVHRVTGEIYGRRKRWPMRFSVRISSWNVGRSVACLCGLMFGVAAGSLRRIFPRLKTKANLVANQRVRDNPWLDALMIPHGRDDDAMTPTAPSPVPHPEGTCNRSGNAV